MRARETGVKHLTFYDVAALFAPSWGAWLELGLPWAANLHAACDWDIDVDIHNEAVSNWGYVGYSIPDLRGFQRPEAFTSRNGLPARDMPGAGKVTCPQCLVLWDLVLESAE